MIFNMTYTGGGKLKYASGAQTAGGDKTLTVTGLGFRPYAVFGVHSRDYASYNKARGFLCGDDGNVVRQFTEDCAPTVSDDGFTLYFVEFGMNYLWWAIGV